MASEVELPGVQGLVSERRSSKEPRLSVHLVRLASTVRVACRLQRIFVTAPGNWNLVLNDFYFIGRRFLTVLWLNSVNEFPITCNDDNAFVNPLVLLVHHHIGKPYTRWSRNVIKK